MLGAFNLPHILWEKYKVLPCKPFTFGRDWELYLLLLESEALRWCRVLWGAGTGKKSVSHFWEVLLRHPLWGRTRMTVPERCVKRVKNLTYRIVKLYAYPMAHGGFSDVWSCQLRYKQSPPERVRPGMESFQWTILIIQVLQVAVKAIRPIFANEEEFLLKRKVASVQVQ